jgi:hypothetical protein
MSAVPARRATIEIDGVRVTYLPDGVTRQRPATQFIDAAPDVRGRNPTCSTPMAGS